jgi:hypothetical protein
VTVPPNLSGSECADSAAVPNRCVWRRIAEQCCCSKRWLRMNTSYKKQIAVTLLGVVLLAPGGCTGPQVSQGSAPADSGHRLVRISFRGQAGSFQMRINEGAVYELANESFTNAMRAFRFQYGDIIVWKAVRDEKGKELSNPQGISAWWFDYLKQVRASFYSINAGVIHDFFQTPLYHWRAPADKPRPVGSASFYADGRLMGRGAPGFRAMLHAFRSEPHATFILAPRINNEGQASPWLAFGQLEEWAEESGAKAELESPDLPWELTDFARLMDDDP